MTFHESILATASSQAWVLLGVNLILSTIVGGIVMIILLAVFSKVWKEKPKYQNAFLMVLLINIINIFGILALLNLSPTAGLVFPIIIWIIFTKGFFSDLKWKHAIVLAIIGYALSIYLFPWLVGLVSGYIPTFGL